MKILHTSDWHLGRTLHGTDLHPHQVAFQEFLLTQVIEREVDVVVVPGDVYDRAVPSLDAVSLLSASLVALAEHATVILTSGNHDSARRLGFGASLMRAGVHILTENDGISRPVTVPDNHGDVLFFGLPYLEPDIARTQLAADGHDALERSHEAVTRAALDRVHETLAAHPGARSVVLAHTFVSGGESSDSERDLRVGGVDSVPGPVFAGLDYVALGHLHGCQDLTGLVGAPAWYSGSPLAFSFSEKDHRKAVLLVEMGAEGVEHVERIPTPVPRRLTELRGPLTEILQQSDAHGEDWVRAIVTDTSRPAHLQETLRAAFPHLLLTEYRPEGRAEAAATPEVRADVDPLEVMDEFLAHVTGAEPTAAEHRVFDDAYRTVRSRAQEAS
ncbi:MAG: exonuclease SbcCD subunit D [Brachybacterium sp.]|nr:exonuclease SbcCD subunit D [Brachybacterium sp.]